MTSSSSRKIKAIFGNPVSRVLYSLWLIKLSNLRLYDSIGVKMMFELFYTCFVYNGVVIKHDKEWRLNFLKATIYGMCVSLIPIG